MAAIGPKMTDRKGPNRKRPDPMGERFVYTVPEAGRLLGLGRNAAYDAAKRGDFPTLRIGRLLLVPKIPFQRMLGIDAAIRMVTEDGSNVAAERGDGAEKGEKA